MIRVLIENVNNTNKKGPNTEPCGTPMGDVIWEKDDVSILTQDYRSCSVKLRILADQTCAQVCGVEWHMGSMGWAECSWWGDFRWL